MSQSNISYATHYLCGTGQEKSHGSKTALISYDLTKNEHLLLKHVDMNLQKYAGLCVFAPPLQVSQWPDTGTGRWLPQEP